MSKATIHGYHVAFAVAASSSFASAIIGVVFRGNHARQADETELRWSADGR